MAENRVRIVIQADGQEALKVVNQLDQAVRGVGDTNQTGGQAGQQSIKDLGQGAREAIAQVQALTNSLAGLRASAEMLGAVGLKSSQALGQGANDAAGQVGVLTKALGNLRDVSGSLGQNAIKAVDQLGNGVKQSVQGQEALKVVNQLDQALKGMGDKAQAGGKEGQKSFQALGQGAREAVGGVEGLNSALGALKSTAATLGLAYSIKEVAGYLKESATEAARYETMGVVLRVVGENAGYTATQMRELDLRLQKTGISMLESRESLSKMAAAQLDLSKAPELGRAAQNAAVIAGTNSSEAFGRIMQGITTGQTILLHHMGLMVDLEGAYRKSAQAMGVSSAALTDYEKRQIALNAVLEEAKSRQGVYEQAMTTAGKQMTSLSRYADDLQVKLGTAFNPATSAVVMGLTHSLQEMQDVVTRKDSQEALASLGAAISNVAGGIINKLPQALDTTLSGLQKILDVWDKMPSWMKVAMATGAGALVGPSVAATAGGVATAATMGDRDEAYLQKELAKSKAKLAELEAQRALPMGDPVGVGYKGVWQLANGVHAERRSAQILDQVTGEWRAMTTEELDQAIAAVKENQAKQREKLVELRAAQGAYKYPDYVRELDERRLNEQAAEKARKEQSLKELSSFSLLRVALDRGLTKEPSHLHLTPEAQLEEILHRYAANFDKMRRANEKNLMPEKDRQELAKYWVKTVESQQEEVAPFIRRRAQQEDKAQGVLWRTQDQLAEVKAAFGGDTLGANIAKIDRQYHQALSQIRMDLDQAKVGVEKYREAEKLLDDIRTWQLRAAQLADYNKQLDRAAKHEGELAQSTYGAQGSQLKSEWLSAYKGYLEDLQQAGYNTPLADQQKISETDVRFKARQQFLLDEDVRRLGEGGKLSDAYYSAEGRKLAAHLDQVKKYTSDDLAYQAYAAQQKDKLAQDWLQNRITHEHSFGDYLADRLSQEYGLYKSALAQRQALYEAFFQTVKTGVDGVEQAIGRSFGDAVGDALTAKFKNFDHYLNELRSHLKEALAETVTQGFKAGLHEWFTKPMMEAMGATGSGQAQTFLASVVPTALSRAVGATGSVVPAAPAPLDERYLPEAQTATGTVAARAVGKGVARWSDLTGYWERYHGLPPGILSAIMQKESEGDPNAKNKASGATGLMQVMPSNFSHFAGQDPKDPSANVAVGAKIFSDFYRKSGGDVPGALKGYGGFVKQDPSSYIAKIMSFMPGGDGYGIMGRDGARVAASAGSQYGPVGVFFGPDGAVQVINAVANNATGFASSGAAGWASLLGTGGQNASQNLAALTTGGSSAAYVLSSGEMTGMNAGDRTAELTLANGETYLVDTSTGQTVSSGYGVAAAAGAGSETLGLSTPDVLKYLGYAKDAAMLGGSGIISSIDAWGYNTLGIGSAPLDAITSEGNVIVPASQAGAVGGLGTTLASAGAAGGIGYLAGSLIRPDNPTASYVGLGAGALAGGLASATGVGASVGAALGIGAGLASTGIGALVAIPAALIAGALTPNTETTEPTGQKGLQVANVGSLGDGWTGWGWTGFKQTTSGMFGSSSTSHSVFPSTADPALAKAWDKELTTNQASLAKALNQTNIGTGSIVNGGFSFDYLMTMTQDMFSDAAHNVTNAMAATAIQAAGLSDAFNQALLPGEDFLDAIKRIGQAYATTNLAAQAAGTSLEKLSGSMDVVGQGNWASLTGKLLGSDSDVATALTTYAQYGLGQRDQVNNVLAATGQQAGTAIGMLGYGNDVTLGNFWERYGYALGGELNPVEFQNWNNAAQAVKAWDDAQRTAGTLMQQINTERISQLQLELKAAQSVKVMVDGLNVSVSSAYSTYNSMNNSLTSTLQGIQWSSSLSPNTPTQTMSQQAAYWNQLKAQVAGEDSSSLTYTQDIQKLTSFSQTYLQSAQKYYGPSSQYWSVYQDVTGTLQGLQSKTESELSVLKQQLKAQNDLVNKNQAQIEQLQMVNAGLQLLASSLDGLGTSIAEALAAFGAQMSWSPDTASSMSATQEQVLASGANYLGAYADGTPGVTGPGYFVAGEGGGPEIIRLGAGQTASVTSNRDFSGTLDRSISVSAAGHSETIKRLDTLIGVFQDLTYELSRQRSAPGRRQ